MGQSLEKQKVGFPRDRRFQELPPFQRSAFPPSLSYRLQLIFRWARALLSLCVSEFVKCALSQDLRQTTDATESPTPGCSFVSSG